MCVSLLPWTTVLNKVSCTRLSVKIALISYWNGSSPIPLRKCASQRRATKICNKFKGWNFWEHPQLDIREYAFNCSSLHEAECSPEHFDTFFIRIGQKMRCCPKKRIGWGVQGGLWKLLFYVIIWVLYLFCQCWSKHVCFFRSRNPFFKVLKNKTFCFLKTLVLRQIKPRGCF